MSRYREEPDDEALELDASMLHPEVDFEKGMAPIPVFSNVLIVLLILAFICQVVQQSLDSVEGLIEVGALNGEQVKQGEVWRLVSAMFLHGSIDHLIGNVIMLYILGMACEHAYGLPQFVCLYVFAGIVGSLFSLIGGHTSVGASGAIFGLNGAILVFFLRQRHRVQLRDKRIGYVLGMWALYQIGLGFFIPGIDNLAHLGGLLGGAALGLVLKPAVLDGRSEVAGQPLTITGVVVAGVCLLYAALFFIPRLVG